MDFIIEKLNDMQKEAVLTGDGPVLILAGAGSGKTRVLTSRVAYLVMEKSVNPSSILAITFTNKAAREINNRVGKMMGGGMWFPWIGTFHSMCLKMLRMYPESLGYRKGFAIYDTDDQKVLIKDCLNELDLDSKLLPPKMIINVISRSKDELIDEVDFSNKNSSDYRMSLVAKVYNVYQKHLVEYNAMDFGDLIFNAVKMLRENDNIRNYFQNAFKHILIDEYQDTNTAQYELAHILSEKHKNIFVVGDDDQSIYGWRGANINNILDFEEDYPGCMVIRLEQNYRSTKNILSAANEVIKNNDDRKGKTLWSDRSRGSKVNYYKATTDSMEAYFVANKILKGMEKGRDYADYAVFYRVNAQSRSIEQALRDKDIPYRVFGGISFYQRKEIKDVLAYLKLLLNVNDNIQLKRVINEPKRGIGKTTLHKMEEYAIDTGSSMYEVAKDADIYPGLHKAAVKLSGFVAMIEKLLTAAIEKSVSDLYDDVIQMTDILKQYELENTINSRSRIENIRELKSAIITKAEDYYESFGEELTLETFLESVTLSTDADNETEGTFVSIMTLHSAKGLEFPVVFMTGMEEGIFPSVQSLGEGRLEEERRLCYVGITRAMDEVYIINTMQRTLYGRTQTYPESQFLREISPNLINYINGSGPSVRKTKTYNRESFGGLRITKGGKPISIAGFTAEAGEAADVKIGQRVRHKKFGDGTVTNTEGSGSDKMIEVAFDMAGKKRLMASFAKLKILD